MSQALPYWRLSGFYFLYFGLLGALLPYWPLYLRELGHDALAIGLLLAIVHGTRIPAPSLWSWLATRTGQRTRVIRLGSLLAALVFAGVLVDQRLAWLALVMAGFSFFWNAVLAQFEVLTLSHLPGQAERYSAIRVWGSVGFIAAVAGLGWLFGQQSVRWLPLVMLGLLAALWLCTLSVAERPRPTRARPSGSLRERLARPEVWSFLGACALLQVSHGPYYAFLSIYLEQQGHGSTAIGLLWALGVVAEVLVFIAMPSLLRWLSLRSLMLVSLGLAVVRWLMIGLWADQLIVLIVAQSLHAATFGSYHAYAVEAVRRLFSGGHEGQGMALYSGLSFGGGGAIGALAAGLGWGVGPSLVFVGAAGVAALALWLGWWGSRPARWSH